jgi:hypothetical protein
MIRMGFNCQEWFWNINPKHQIRMLMLREIKRGSLSSKVFIFRNKPNLENQSIKSLGEKLRSLVMLGKIFTNFPFVTLNWLSRKVDRIVIMGDSNPPENNVGRVRSFALSITTSIDWAGRFSCKKDRLVRWHRSYFDDQRVPSDPPMASNGFIALLRRWGNKGPGQVFPSLQVDFVYTYFSKAFDKARIVCIRWNLLNRSKIISITRSFLPVRFVYTMESPTWAWL